MRFYLDVIVRNARIWASVLKVFLLWFPLADRSQHLIEFGLFQYFGYRRVINMRGNRLGIVGDLPRRDGDDR